MKLERHSSIAAMWQTADSHVPQVQQGWHSPEWMSYFQRPFAAHPNWDSWNRFPSIGTQRANCNWSIQLLARESTPPLISNICPYFVCFFDLPFPAKSTFNAIIGKNCVGFVFCSFETIKLAVRITKWLIIQLLVYPIFTCEHNDCFNFFFVDI